MTIPSALAQPIETGVLAYPGLERRSALRDRRPRALRRHTTRVATRFAVLVAGDIVAILLARADSLGAVNERATAGLSSRVHGMDSALAAARSESDRLRSEVLRARRGGADEAIPPEELDGSALKEQLSDAEQRAVLDAHPAIGTRQALSVRSAAEQGSDDDPELLGQLAELNRAYEDRFGFRFVVFVNRRPRREIVPILRSRLERTAEQELETGVDELVLIAIDRWRQGS